MLYPKNQEKKLDPQLFKCPTSEYRGTPFWAWNGKLNEEDLSRQIALFQKMGFGGAHMHVRTGLDTPYLTDEYMGYIRYCLEEFKKRKMLAWLYDEDRWPSGSAGGKVTLNHPERAKKTLLLTAHPYVKKNAPDQSVSEAGRGHHAVRQDNGDLLAIYDISLDEEGCLKDVIFYNPGEVEEKEYSDGVITRWFAYMEYATNDPWFNDAPYVDVLNKEAIDAFLQSTHEVYAKEFQDEFGKNMPAIFTDEPQYTPHGILSFPEDSNDRIMPWTQELPALYAKHCGGDLLKVLPELYWELPGGKKSEVRWHFNNVLANRFTANYVGRIGKWCEDRNLYLTGHVNGEASLTSQTCNVGDAMRSYPGFGIPGIDMLCDFHEYTTAKQTASIVHQQGKEAMMSELYGVTGWDYDFRGYKLQGDWQAAMGVTVRVPHLAWMTMKGEAKRDYPASINEQSPWAEEYSLVEDHFSRLNTAMTRGKADIRIAVLHPIESFWLLWGPFSQTGIQREKMEQEFAAIPEVLLSSHLDYDYLCEETLPSQAAQNMEANTGTSRLGVGQMAYDAVIIPSVITLRSTTIALLEDFIRRGGKVLTLGDCPEYVDAKLSDGAKALYEKSRRISLDQTAVSEALKEERFFTVFSVDGRTAHQVGANLIYQHRIDGDSEWLFVCNGQNPVCPDVDPKPFLRFTVKGEYTLELYDTLTGEIRPLQGKIENGETSWEKQWFMHDSILVHLTRVSSGEHSESEKAENFENEDQDPYQKVDGLEVIHMGHGSDEPSITLKRVPYTLTEPNMLLLDMAQYAADDGEWQPEEEILRIDNQVRASLGIPLRRKEVTQPYCLEKEVPTHQVHLRFEIESELELEEVKLALEDRKDTRVVWNGTLIEAKTEGYFVDQKIEVISLGALQEGMNILEISAPIARRTNLEAFYLLGDFGVRVFGNSKVLVKRTQKLGFADISRQDLAFYTGNVIYHLEVQSEGNFKVRVPQYRGGLVKVWVDGQEAGRIAFSPYELEVKAEKGVHKVDLELFGTRYNGFAQLHHTQGIYFYQSPNSWRSQGDLWNYSYQFKNAGILKSPEITGGVIL